MNHLVVKNMPLKEVPVVPEPVRALVSLVYHQRGMLLWEVLEHITLQELEGLRDFSVLLQLPSLLGDDLVMVGANAHHHLGLQGMVIQSYDSSVNCIYLRSGVRALEELGWEETAASPLGLHMREVVDEHGRVHKAAGTFHGLTAYSIRENLKRLHPSDRMVVLHRDPQTLLKGCSYYKKRLRLMRFAPPNPLFLEVTEVPIP